MTPAYKPCDADDLRRVAARLRRLFARAALGGLIGLSAGCASPHHDTAELSPPALHSAAPLVLPVVNPDGLAPLVGGPAPLSAGPRSIGEMVQPVGLMAPAPPVAYPAAAPLPTFNTTLNPGAKPDSPQSIDDASPIDLPTALQLVDANSPTVAVARARVREAFLAQRQAELAWLPDLRTGPTYNRHDGRDSQSNGTIFEVSKQNLFVGGGAELEWDTSELLFGRLAAARLTDAAQASARAVNSNVQLDVALAYFDLVQAYGEYAIFSDALSRAEEMLRNAESAEKAGLSKTTADINRARTEVDTRRERRFQLEAEIATDSAHLARLLLLKPTTILKPNDPRIVPIGLIPDPRQLDELVSIGLSNRPELQQNRALVAAATTRWRQAQVGPLIPHLGLAYAGGTYGGGPNSQFGDFGASSDGTAEAFWELHNMGAGEVIQSRLRETQANEASLNLTDVQARVAEDVTAAAQSARANQKSLEVAEQAVVQATETWRRLREASFGLAGAEHQYDPLQPLIALRDLADARTLYLSSVINYNKSQVRLYWAMGQPPLGSLPQLPPRPLNNTPVVPEPYHPAPENVPPPAKQ